MWAAVTAKGFLTPPHLAGALVRNEQRSSKGFVFHNFIKFAEAILNSISRHGQPFKIPGKKFH